MEQPAGALGRDKGPHPTGQCGSFLLHPLVEVTHCTFLQLGCGDAKKAAKIPTKQLTVRTGCLHHPAPSCTGNPWTNIIRYKLCWSDVHHCDKYLREITWGMVYFGFWFQSMVGWLHCLWATVRWKKLMAREGIAEHVRDKKGSETRSPSNAPPVTSFLKPGPTSHHLPMMPSDYKSISGLIHSLG
jgi:hypothetical protein